MKKIILLCLSLVGVSLAQVVPQPLPEIEHLQGNNYLFSWQGVPGRVYFVQTSSQAPTEDGFIWEFAPDIRLGMGDVLEMGFEADPEKAEFFRLVYIDYVGIEDIYFADFDGDGYSNLQEAMENTDPFDPESKPTSPRIYRDSDGDGISDQDEYILGLDPHTRDEADSSQIAEAGPLLISRSVNYEYKYDTGGFFEGQKGTGFVTSKISQEPYDPYPISSPWTLKAFHTSFDSFAVPKDGNEIDRYQATVQQFNQVKKLLPRVFSQSRRITDSGGEEKNNWEMEKTAHMLKLPFEAAEEKKYQVLAIPRYSIQEHLVAGPITGPADETEEENRIRVFGIVDEGVHVDRVRVETFTIDAGATASNILEFEHSISGVRENLWTIESTDLLTVEVVPDWNRDGKITGADRGRVSAENPWRFWVNDDDDKTYEERKDKGADIPAEGRRDSDDLAVDGIRDLLDFFPLHLDLKEVLQVLPKEDYTYRIKHSERAINYHEIVETKLGNNSDEDGPLAYLKNVEKCRELRAATLMQADPVGSILSEEILSAFEKGEGVLICEATRETESPLVLAIMNNIGKTVVEIEFPLNISGVEEMFRSKYLAENLNGGTQGAIPRDPPNWPDADRNGRHFVFVHGYNVNPTKARGWNSEVFKRLFFSGSNACFTGVSWNGSESQIIGTSITPDYWRNVHNAFRTSKSIADFVNALPSSGGKHIAAHSLGNIVVSSAIKDHGLQVTQYFMVDAAAPLEAYSPGTSHKNKMSHPSWRRYEQRVWSTDYHKLFGSGDGRSKLTWIDRFGAFPNAYNFHSTGEEVLKNGDGSVPASVSFHFWGIGGVAGTGGELAWVKNEMSKGFGLLGGGGFGHNATGGWDFNERYLTGGIKPSTDEVEALSDATLQIKPVFEEFKYERIFYNLPDPNGGDETWGSATANDYNTRAEILAEMLPALSFAAGSNPVDSFDSPEEDRNFDMMTMKNDWITNGEDEDWKHSDIRDVAYLYTRRVYEKFVELGNLNQ